MNRAGVTGALVVCVLLGLHWQTVAAEKPSVYAALVNYEGEDGTKTTITTTPAGSPIGSADALVRYQPSLAYDGWDRLDVQAAGTGRKAAFAAGFGEGFLSQKSIWSMFRNNYADWFTDQGDGGYPADKAYTWLRQNYNWTRAEANSRAASDPYWSWVATTLDQLEGLAVGYNRAAPAAQQLSFSDFLLLNADGDVETLQVAFGPPSRTSMGPREMRCSAMFRLADDSSDLFFGHTTWDHFDMMYRTLKTYAWGSAVTVKMSSSPGFLSSVDDFYLTSRGLAVIETTNGNFNNRLWSQVHPSSVLSWIRANVANAAASTAAEWTGLFATENSGTYNNQWMVLDMKRFKPGHPLPNSSFLILEQLPGECVVEDKSSHMNEQRYWGSYNIPAIGSVWKKSGFGRLRPSWQDSHSRCPRARMMAALNSSINSVDDHKQALRYNKFGKDSDKKDEWAGFGISARFDLLPVNSSNYAISGGMDSKVSSVSLALPHMKFWAQNGPSHDGPPVFDWRQQGPFPNSQYKVPPLRMGLPDRWEFDWIMYE